MGNYCVNKITEPGFQTSNDDGDFVRSSWSLLKKNHQLSFISPNDENEIVNQLNAVPRQKEPAKFLLAGNTPNRCIIIKQNAYLYVGEVAKERMHGVGTVALPTDKLFIGNFKNGRIEGQGQFRLTTNCSKPVRLKGQWGEKITGTLSIGNGYCAFPFSINKSMIFEQEECKYIQYPNYDEYIGETLQGLADGQGKYIYRNGDKERQFPIYEGHFRKGKREGRGVMRFSPSMQLDIHWKAGKPQGFGYLIINNMRNSVLYKNGLRKQKVASDVEE